MTDPDTIKQAIEGTVDRAETFGGEVQYDIERDEQGVCIIIEGTRFSVEQVRTMATLARTYGDEVTEQALNSALGAARACLGATE